MSERFPLRSMVSLVRPAGYTACDLEDLRVGIGAVSTSSLFHHAFGAQLRHPTAEELAAHDDFSAWVNGVIQDRETAERLSFVIHDRSSSAAELRDALVEVLVALPEKTRRRATPEDGKFVFLDVDIVVVDTGLAAADPSDLVDLLEDAEPAVLFYHLLAQPWLDPAAPSLVEWVRERGEERLAGWLQPALASGRPIEQARRRVVRLWRRSRLGARVIGAARIPESERRESGRRAVARLVRQLKRGDKPA